MNPLLGVFLWTLANIIAWGSVIGGLAMLIDEKTRKKLSVQAIAVVLAFIAISLAAGMTLFNHAMSADYEQHQEKHEEQK